MDKLKKYRLVLYYLLFGLTVGFIGLFLIDIPEIRLYYRHCQGFSCLRYFSIPFFHFYKLWFIPVGFGIVGILYGITKNKSLNKAESLMSFIKSFFTILSLGLLISIVIFTLYIIVGKSIDKNFSEHYDESLNQFAFELKDTLISPTPFISSPLSCLSGTVEAERSFFYVKADFRKRQLILNESEKGTGTIKTLKIVQEPIPVDDGSYKNYNNVETTGELFYEFKTGQHEKSVSKLFLYDYSTEKERKILTVNKDIDSLKLTPDGKKLTYLTSVDTEENSQKLWLFEFFDRTYKYTTFNIADYIKNTDMNFLSFNIIGWSEDEYKIYLIPTYKGREYSQGQIPRGIYEIDISKNSFKKTYVPDVWVIEGVLSPDRSKLAYTTASDMLPLDLDSRHPRMIVMTDLRNFHTEKIVLPDKNADYRNLQWSPDGEHIGYVKVAPNRLNGSNSIMIVDVNSHKKQTVVESKGDFLTLDLWISNSKLVYQEEIANTVYQKGTIIYKDGKNYTNRTDLKSILIDGCSQTIIDTVIESNFNVIGVF